MILVTGATGNVGVELLKALASRGTGEQVRVLVRDPSRLKVDALPAGAEVVTGDFDQPDTLAPALAGVERAFLVTPSSERAEQQQLSFVEAARQGGLAHIVKLSQLAADADSPVRFLRYHAVVEAAIRDSGMAFTFLRPNLFMQGLLMFRDSIVHQGQFFAPAGDAKISAVDVRDIAAAAAAALIEPGHTGKTYTLTGPQALTHTEIAEELSRALGKTVTFVDVPPEAMREAALGFGVPEWQADGLIEDYAHYRRGEAAEIATGVEDATGRPPYTFTQFARDYAPAFGS